MKDYTVIHTIQAKESDKYTVKDSEGNLVTEYNICILGELIDPEQLAYVEQVSYKGFICYNGDIESQIENPLCSLVFIQDPEEPDGYGSVKYSDDMDIVINEYIHCLNFDGISCDFQNQLELNK